MRATLEQRRELRSHTASLLATLGKQPEEVARNLEGAMVKGVPSNPESCAIAAYLWAVIGSDARVESLKVTPWRVVLGSTVSRRPVTVPLTPALQCFVQRFDHCAYPELIRNEAPVPSRV